MRLNPLSRRRKGAAPDDEQTPKNTEAQAPDDDGPGGASWEEVRAAYESDPNAYTKLAKLDDKASAGGRKRVLWRNRIILIILALALLVGLARCANIADPDLSGLAQVEDSSAEAFAASYVSDWYTWDDENPQERGTRISQYNPAFTYNQGWNSQGTQDVTDAVAVDTEQPEDSKYVVTVRYNVEGRATPSYAEVALYSDGNGISPLSMPAIVPPPNLPLAQRPEDQRETSGNREENALLEERLEVFFTAWANGDRSTLDAVTTSAGPKDALDGDLTFDSFADVEVFTPNADDQEFRTVRVTVNWESESGASSQSVYEVDMTNETDRWLIDALDAAADDPDAYVTGDSAEQSSGSGQSAAPSPTATESATESASPEPTESGDDSEDASEGESDDPSDEETSSGE